MAKRTGIESHQEWQSAWVHRDARPPHVRIADFLSHPKRMAALAGATGFFGLAAPAFAIPAFLFGSGLSLWWGVSGSRRKQLPLQVPQQAGLIDRSEVDPKTKRPKLGEGILYLGTNRSEHGEQEECWVNNSQARTHFLVAGTTGSGKTMTLLGMLANALTWGSGGIYADGKAANDLWYNAFSLARRFGRDDHVYVLNFMTGGVDIFAVKKDGKRRSNSFNPVSRGSSDDMTQMMSSLMAEAGGDNAMWKGLAVGMMDAVIRGLCFRRFKEGLEIDAAIIRDSIELTNLIEMVRYFLRQQDVPQDLVLKPLEAYLRNLPGLSWEDHVIGDNPPEPETKKQHDFRSMQFLRQLTMIADTYGKIFRQQIPEVDMLDIVLNNRILVVMIPSMEKSEEEAGAVGKLVVTALRMMMAMNLGDQVEGMYADAVESRATNSPSPFICILDELGYYFTKGLAVIFAQARSLGFAMVAAMQDFPALMKGSNKEEAESVIANTKFKESLAMEDSEKTADFFLKTAGKAIVSEVSGYSGEVGAVTTGYRDMMNASMQERERVTLQELRDMDTSDSIMMWRDRIVRMTTFAPYLMGFKPTTKFPVRLNRLIGMHPPSMAGERRDLEGFAETAGGGQQNSQLLVEQLVAGIFKPVLSPKASSPFDAALRRLWESFPEDRTDISGKDGDLAMFATLSRWVKAPAQVPTDAGTEGAGGSAASSGGGMAVAMKPAAAGDEVMDAAQIILSLESLPVKEVAAEEGGDEAADWIMQTVQGAAESVVVKEEVTHFLAQMDTALTAKPPGDPDEASKILMEGVNFEPVRPPAEPVDQDSASQQIEDIMRSIMG